MKQLEIIKNRGSAHIKVTYTLVYLDDDGAERRATLRTKKQAENYLDYLKKQRSN